MTRPDGGPRPAHLLTERRVAFGALLACVMVLGMGQTIMFAILPPIGRELGLSELQVGAIFSLSALMWVVMSPFWGRLSDRWRRKPVILIGMGGYIVSMIAFTSIIQFGLISSVSLALVYPLMVLSRGVYGAIGPGVRVAAQAYIVDRTELKDRTVAIAGLSAAFGLGNTLGPGLGSAVSVFGLLAPLWGIVALAIVMAATCMILLPEKSAPGFSTGRTELMISDRRIRPFLVYGIVMSYTLATPMQATAFYFIDVLGLDINTAAQFAGVGLSSSAMATLFSQLVLVQRFRLSPNVMMISGAALVGCSHLLIAVSSEFGPLVFSLMLSGLGGGLAIPGFTAGASLAVGPEDQGAVAGMTGGVIAAGFSIVPFIAFSLYKLAPQAPFFLDAALMAVLLGYAARSATIRGARLPASRTRDARGEQDSSDD
jgi:MFS family permease